MRETCSAALPLSKPADDAIELDTTSLTIPEVVERVTDLLAQRGIA